MLDGDYKIRSLDAYYLEDTEEYFYNCKYRLYIEVLEGWYEIDSVLFGPYGGIDGEFCLNWDDLTEYKEDIAKFERAKKEGIHKSYKINDVLAGIEKAMEECKE